MTQWSPYQLAIFEAVKTTTDSLLIEATAGSGKTTTIVEAIKHVPRGQSVVFLAFNKHIADELKRRIPSGADCKTIHSVGDSAWRNFLGVTASNCKVENGKTRMIAKDYCTALERARYGEDLGRLTSIMKGSGMVPKDVSLKGLLEDDDKIWEQLIYHYGLDTEGCNPDVTRKVLRRSIKFAADLIDYDDMLYMPVISDARFDKYDVIFLDEAQDVNAIQIEIVDRMRKPTSRVIAVGDRNQAIYGFRGSMADCMDHIQARFNCTELPLTVSYRCPRTIVKKAQEFVSHIQHHETAPEGLVWEYPETWYLKDFLQTDAILCRNSKPLISLAFMLIRNKVSCQVIGRDIGTGLIKLIKKMKARNIPEMVQNLAQYRKHEMEKAKARDDESRMASLDDKLETINVFIDESVPGATPDTLIAEIDLLFSDTSNGRLSLSTIHKSKGMEWERVFVLDAHILMPSRYAKKKWQLQQETNLAYVAATRSKCELYYISSESLREGSPKIVAPEPKVVVAGKIEDDESVVAALAEGREA
jgi:DNA helicase-2/ATP-dependent DNA helicase PcrA